MSIDLILKAVPPKIELAELSCSGVCVEMCFLQSIMWHHQLDEKSDPTSNKKCISHDRAENQSYPDGIISSESPQNQSYPNGIMSP